MFHFCPWYSSPLLSLLSFRSKQVNGHRRSAIPCSQCLRRAGCQSHELLAQEMCADSSAQQPCSRRVSYCSFSSRSHRPPPAPPRAKSCSDTALCLLKLTLSYRIRWWTMGPGEQACSDHTVITPGKRKPQTEREQGEHCCLGVILELTETVTTFQLE